LCKQAFGTENIQEEIDCHQVVLGQDLSRAALILPCIYPRQQHGCWVLSTTTTMLTTSIMLLRQHSWMLMHHRVELRMWKTSMG
jgi:hypothetical protein